MIPVFHSRWECEQLRFFSRGHVRQMSSPSFLLFVFRVGICLNWRHKSTCHTVTSVFSFSPVSKGISSFCTGTRVTCFSTFSDSVLFKTVFLYKGIWSGLAGSVDPLCSSRMLIFKAFFILWKGMTFQQTMKDERVPPPLASRKQDSVSQLSLAPHWFLGLKGWFPSICQVCRT